MFVDGIYLLLRKLIVTLTVKGKAESGHNLWFGKTHQVFRKNPGFLPTKKPERPYGVLPVLKLLKPLEMFDYLTVNLEVITSLPASTLTM